MVNTRRSPRRKCEPNAAYNENRTVKYRKVINPNLRSIQPSIEDDFVTLLEHCFDRMLPHVWYKIIPSSPYDVETVAFAMGQSWLIVLGLLLKLKYLAKYGKLITIKHEKWRNLEHVSCDQLRTYKLHYSSRHPLNGKLVYYLCKHKPLYDNPTIQHGSNYSHASLRYFDAFDHQLKCALSQKLDVTQLNESTCVRKERNITVTNETSKET